MKKPLLVLTTICLSACLATAQGIIKGKIIDQNGVLPYATVSAAEREVITSTAPDGTFSLSL